MMNTFHITTESPPPPPPPPPPLSPPIIIPPTICIHEVSRTVHVNENSHIIFKLTQAIEEDSLSKITSLIEDQGVDVNSTLSYGVSILLKAIRSRSVKVVNYLINKGADPESSIRDMMKRPEGLEVENCRASSRYDKWCVDILKQLLPRLGQKLHNIIDNEGRTLLHLACYFPDLSLFQYLLQFGLDPNVKDNKDSSVLCLLISHQDTRASYEMMQHVLSLPNVQVDIKNNFGFTPLYHSFLLNRLDFFYLLLEKGADPFERTYCGNTLMHCPFIHAPKYLILHDLGLDVNAKNDRGLKPLQNKADLGVDFFILILLGREVSDGEYEKMEKTFEPGTIRRIREKVEKGEFSGMRLQSLCRHRIRNVLFQIDHNAIIDSIWSLPLPKPLRLYLDVPLYAQHLLDVISS